MTLRIYAAEPQHVPRVLPMYMGYLNFYQVQKTTMQAQQYLTERLNLGQSRIFYAELDGAVAGFCQLYPLFCSLEMKRIWLLYDLYVTPPARRHGVAEALLERADQLGRESDAAFIMLSTAQDNHPAQTLYEQHHYVQDNEFVVYNRRLD